jgi:hypothetical protein
MRSLVRLRPVRGRSDRRSSGVQGVEDELKNLTSRRVISFDCAVSPSLGLRQHIVIALLRAAEFRCRLIYLILTGASRARVQARDRRAVTVETEMVIRSEFHVISHVGCNGLDISRLLLWDLSIRGA